MIYIYLIYGLNLNDLFERAILQGTIRTTCPFHMMLTGALWPLRLCFWMALEREFSFLQLRSYFLWAVRTFKRQLPRKRLGIFFVGCFYIPPRRWSNYLSTLYLSLRCLVLVCLVCLMCLVCVMRVSLSVISRHEIKSRSNALVLLALYFIKEKFNYSSEGSSS